MLNCIFGFELFNPLKLEAKIVPEKHCEDFNLTSNLRFRTESYIYNLCWNKNNEPFYLGSKRDSNNYILLPITEWGDGFFKATNNNYSYVYNPACGPTNTINYCDTWVPPTLTIYNGTTIIDEEVVGSTSIYN